MDAIKYSIVISPENVKGDLVFLPYSGTYYSEQCGIPTDEDKVFNFGLYSAFTEVISSGPNGSSSLTGLTIPILFTQSINDIGYYSEFDGFILQKDVACNFVYTGNTSNSYNITLYNKSGSLFQSFLRLSNYEVNWGDGTPVSTFNQGNAILNHTYPSFPSGYTITLKQINPWGITTINKKVKIPFTGVTVDNQQGEIFFTPQGGSWSGIPLSYDYIFTGDSGYDISQYLSENYTDVPFVVSGYTKSKLIDLKKYGPTPYTIGYIKYSKGIPVGQINEITQLYTAYTINSVQYYDFNDGTTFFMAESSGITSNEFVVSALTKNEYLLDFVMAPEINSNVYIERGKFSAYEPLQRLGEVDNIGDLVRYGYGYYKINVI
jgi:hypothetical protein